MRRALPAAGAFVLLTVACQEVVAPDRISRGFEIRPESTLQQSGSIGFPAVVPPVVRVLRLDGSPAAGVEVSWRVLEGGGSVDTPTTTTDAEGVASVGWTFGEAPGQQLLTAEVERGGSVTFRGTAEIYYSSVSAGWRHTCATDVLGHAHCWGDNRWGQLGSGTVEASAAPIRVTGGTRFARLFAGWLHSCALTSSGEAHCWGDNSLGQLGSGDNYHRRGAIRVAGGHSFTALSLGTLHTCGVRNDGAVLCWGSNAALQLGIGADPPDACRLYGADEPCAVVPRHVVLPGPAIAVAAGELHTCAALVDGAAYCWGDNKWGELGIGVFGGSRASPERTRGSVSFAQLAAHSRTTCGLDAGGAAYCWGMNTEGRLGSDAPWNIAEPSAVATLERFVEIGMGDAHTCARRADGIVFCWGAVTGSGSGTGSPVPARTAGGPFTSLSVGGHHSCATSDAIWCWGSNDFMQLAPEAGPSAATPVPVLPFADPP